MIEILGWIGLLLLAIAWVPQTIKTIMTKHAGIPLSFSIIYVLGSGLLVIYSVIIVDYVFIILNSLATASALVNFVVTLMYGK